MEILVTIYAF